MTEFHFRVNYPFNTDFESFETVNHFVKQLIQRFKNYLQHRWSKRLFLVESLRLSQFEDLAVVQCVHLILEELQRRGFAGQSPGDLLPDDLHHL